MTENEKNQEFFQYFHLKWKTALQLNCTALYIETLTTDNQWDLIQKQQEPGG